MVQKRKIKRLIRNFPSTILKTAQRLRSVCVKAIRTMLRKPFVKKALKQKDYLVEQAPVYWKQIKQGVQKTTQMFVRNYIPKQFFNPKSLRVGVASLLLGILVVQLFLPAQNVALAGTATFVQSSWAGGASSTAVAVDPTNRTGWTYFNTSTNVDFATSAIAPRLSSSTYSFTDDTTTSTTGVAAGGGFANGTLSNTTYDSANTKISLGVASQTAVNDFQTQYFEFPQAVNISNVYATGTYAYFLTQATSAIGTLTRFDSSNSTTATFATLPASMGAGGVHFAFDENYVYFSPSTGVLTSFYRHTLANTSSAWESFTALPAVPSTYAHVIVDSGYVYLLRGGNLGVYRHTTANTSSAWETFTNPPANPNGGVAGIYNGYIYIIEAANTTNFYRHTTANTSSVWESFTALPAVPGSGSTGMVFSGDYVYVLRANNTQSVWRHTVSNTSSAWESLASLPASADAGAGFVSDANYLYVLAGNSGTNFYRHTFANTSSAWESFTALPAAVSTGSALAVSNNSIYAILGNGTSAWASHSISNTSSVWVGSHTSAYADMPGTVGIGGDMVTDNEYIYVLQGNSTGNVYRRSLFTTSTAWEEYIDLPATVTYYGSKIAYDSNYIYVLRVTGGTVYRHSRTVTSSAWETFSSSFTNSGTGSAIYTDSNYIYLFSGSSNNTTTYRHSVTTTAGSWESYSSLPGVTSNGAAAVFDSNYAYLFPGATTSFYRHSLADRAAGWERYATLASSPNNGTAVAVDANYVYLVRGSGAGVYRHTLSDTSSAWETYTSLPVAAGTGTELSIDGSYMYVTNAGAASVYRHALSTTSSAWTTYTAPATFSALGSSLALNPNGNGFFVLPGNSNASMYGYAFDTIVYASTGNFTSAAITVGASNLNSISWTSSTPSIVGSNALQIQIATSSDNNTYSSYVGSDGTSGTYFSSGSATLTGSLAAGAKYFKYKAYLATDNTAVTPYLNDLTVNYRAYSATGTIQSSIYDTGDPANRVASMQWTGTTSSIATLQFQIRTASSSAGITSATWTGPDGTNSTYFTSAAGGDTVTSTYADGSGDQYVQYQVFFATDGTATPVLASATLTYVVNQAPQVQNVTATQNSDGTVSIAYEIRSPDTTEDTGSTGVLTPSFKYCAGGTICSSITALLTGATSTKSVNVDGVTWTAVTTTWTPTIDFSNTFDTSAKVMVTANDLQAANNFGYATSSAFTLDTKVPSGVSILVDATSTLAVITVTATDTSTPVVMRIATSTSALAAASYGNFATTTALALGVDPATIYVQFKDAYGNSTTAASVTTPETPDYMIIQDNSNVTPPAALDYRLFVAWKAVALPPQGSFGAYKVYRSEDQSSWTLLTTITDRTTNFYTDTTVSSSTREYYKVVSTDSLGNVSFSSDIVNGMADGVQDYGEGGGGTEPPPVITSIATSTITPSSFTVTWDTDTLSNSRVSYSATAGVFTSNVTVASYVNTAATIGQHNVIVAGLTPDTTYYFKVASTDAGSNISEDTNGGNGYIVRTSPGPTITALPTAGSLTNSSAIISWETSLDANSLVTYSTSSQFITSSTASNLATFATTHDITVSSLTANTTYYYFVASTDQSGYTVYDKNVVSGAAQYYTFSTTNDSDAPTFSGISATVNTSSASIIWTTNKAADSMVDYGLTSSYTSSTTHDTTRTIQHYQNITNLQPNTTYHYRITSIDANSNSGQSSDQTFTTNQLDTIPPVISSVTTSSVALTQATISWTTDKQANHTVEFGTTDAYGSIAGNLYDFTSTTHSVTLTSLSGNTTYYFRANSTDQSGNNATSSQYTFVTTADVTPPVISAITQIVEQTAVIVQWTTDELAMSEVTYGLASTTLDTSVSVTSSYRTSHTLALTGLSPNTTYYFRVMSADTSANTTTESVATFTTVAYGQTTRTIVSGGSNNNAFADTTVVTAPVLTNVKVASKDSFSAILTWDTDKVGNSFVKYGKSTTYGQFAGNDTESVLQHSVALFNLDPATTYHFKAMSFGAAGGPGVSDDIVFTTLNEAGETVTSTPDNKSPDEEGQNSKDDFINNGVKTASTQLLQRILRSISANPLLKAIPQDAIIQSISDIAERVVNAPSIVGLRPEVQVQGTRAIIGWYTDKKTDGVVSYATHADYKPASDHAYTLNATDASPLSTVHIVDLANLEPATQYHFQVVSKGEFGPETRSKDFVFTTESVLPVIENFAITEIRANAVELSWKTNIPTISTLVYTNVKTKKTFTVGDQTYLVNHTFIVPDLDPGAAYTVLVKAENEAKDIISSKALSFTTTIDNGAPTITNLAANSTLYPGKNSKVQTIMTWKTDEPASSQIFYQEGVQAAGSVLSTPFNANLATEHILVLTNFKPGTVYKYWSESVDSSGNASQSASFTMLTPIQKETIIDIIGKNFQSIFGWTNRVAL